MKDKSYFISHVSYIILLSLPSVSFAAPLAGVNSLLTAFYGLVSKAIPIAFGLAILFFFYGIALYIFRAGDEKKAQEGKSIMVYGVIALFVMVSILGLIKFIGDNLGIDTGVRGGSTTGQSGPTITEVRGEIPLGH